MKVTDYIIEFLVEKNITDIFGYPGGVICHLIDSVSKYSNITAHVTYNEQGAAFAACGYAQASHKVGVAFATSGPGATNLVTGIANAYFDSTPAIFFTGQVDTYASAAQYPVRQRGFQETDVVGMTSSISKWAIRVDNPLNIKCVLEKAYYIATSENPGPVVIDLPADVQRAEVDIESLTGFYEEKSSVLELEIDKVIEILSKSSRPVILAGNGIKQAQLKKQFNKLVEKAEIPVVSSLPAFDLLEHKNQYNFGFIGTNGNRFANFIVGKCDLIIALGSRLDIRQIGLARDKFATQAQLIQVNIDESQFNYKVNNDEINIHADLKQFIPRLTEVVKCNGNGKWIEVCKELKHQLQGYDSKEYNLRIEELCDRIPENTNITIDVGQHQLWIAQCMKIKAGQDVYMSAGHGAMGYSIPAAIGVHYATHKPVVAFCGDGGLMMNVQELQFIARERIPIAIVCVNNYALGMIRGFQERNFNGNYQLTTSDSGYSVPDLNKMSDLFEFEYRCVESKDEINSLVIDTSQPTFIELRISTETVLEPNFGKNGLIQDQMPYINRELFDKLMSL